MEKDNKYIFRFIYSLVLVFAILLSVVFTSVYYKVFYVGSNDYMTLDRVYEELDKNYYKEIDRETLYGGAITGMVNALEDPYSTYMTPEETEQFELMLENQFVGIGVQIEQTVSGGYITKVFEDSPAEKAGLAEGDVFSTVDGTDVLGMSIDELSSLVRGPEGSEVEIGIKRAGEVEDITFKIKRESIELVDLTYAMYGTNNDVGYIKINDFTGDIHSQFSSAYKDLKLNGMNTLIIDVRDNGGGYLEEVLNIVNMFADDSKPIYQEKIKDKVTDEVYGTKTKENIEVAVLINENSASASELLAAALDEINGSVLIGTTTYGKGTAQTAKTYSDGSTIKYTYAQWLTPDGNWINEVGVAPTIELELNLEFYYSKVLVSDALKVDTVGIQVANGQKILNALGYTTREDGYFGNDTVEAVKAFQAANDLEVSGSIDGKTANKLNEKFQAHLSNHEKDNQIVKAIEVLENE